MDVLDYKKYVPEELDEDNGLIRCKYFEVEFVEGDKRITLDNGSFYSVTCLKGEGNLELKELSLHTYPGDTVFIPATDGTLEIKGDASLAITRV